MLLFYSYLYTQPNNRTYRSSCYKVPLHYKLIVLVANMYNRTKVVGPQPF